MADTSQQTLLDRVFAATSTEESRQLYDEWAKTYNSDMTEHDFTAPRLVAEAVARGLKLNHLPNKMEALSKIKIADAGCGTGLVGVELSKLGAKHIDGLDISKGMLDVAGKTGAYKDLRIADLTTRLPIVDGTYDAVTCCGTFTHGHLGPEPLTELVRIVKTSGIVVATVLDSYWQEKGFEAEVERLHKQGKIDVVENDVHSYRKDAGGGRVLVLRKTSGADTERYNHPEHSLFHSYLTHTQYCSRTKVAGLFWCSLFIGANSMMLRSANHKQHTESIPNKSSDIAAVASTPLLFVCHIFPDYCCSLST
jgi:ubiquinone/menaquinone biosynthesis C-methylase UbiE